MQKFMQTLCQSQQKTKITHSLEKSSVKNFLNSIYKTLNILKKLIDINPNNNVFLIIQNILRVKQKLCILRLIYKEKFKRKTKLIRINITILKSVTGWRFQ